MERCSVFFFATTTMGMDLVSETAQSAEKSQAHYPVRPDVRR